MVNRQTMITYSRYPLSKCSGIYSRRNNLKEIYTLEDFEREIVSKSTLKYFCHLLGNKGPISLLKLVSLENFLSDLTGVKVDIVPKEDIRPELKEKILEEVIYL